MIHLNDVFILFFKYDCDDSNTTRTSTSIISTILSIVWGLKCAELIFSNQPSPWRCVTVLQARLFCFTPGRNGEPNRRHIHETAALYTWTFLVVRRWHWEYFKEFSLGDIARNSIEDFATWSSFSSLVS